MYGLTAEDLGFRDTVRDFIEREFPSDLARRLRNGESPTRQEQVDWHGVLYERGWAVPHWPKEWGGQDWTAVQRFILREMLEAHPALLPLSMNVNLCGPIVARFGSQQQKARFLPRMARLDDWWCQGFSEPGAGSDLASLKTSARIDGDHFVVNGSKMWTTHAQYANWMFCVVRTNPDAKQQEGISFILFPMDTPGVSVRPIQLMEGGHEVNQCFFDDVRVPIENLVGELNRGWDCAKYLLTQERFNSARVGSTNERLSRLLELAAIEKIDGRPLIEHPSFGRRIARIEAEARAHEVTTLRLLDEDSRRGPGDPPNPLSSLLKQGATDIRQELAHMVAEIAGPAAARLSLETQEDWLDFAPDWSGLATANYLNSRKFSIYGGSSEVQRTILARSVLGL